MWLNLQLSILHKKDVMKFAKKIPPTDKELSMKLKSDGWKIIKEPKSIGIATLRSLPFALLLGAVTLIVTYWLNPSIYEFLNIEHGFGFSFNINLFTLLYVFGVLVLMLFHEFLHAVFIPNFLKSNKTYWGINGVFGFVATSEKLKKDRFIKISLMPYLLLSVLLPFVLYAFGLLNGYTVFLCLINAMASCVDFLNICLIGFQVPKNAYIINNGFETFYK